MVTSSAKTYESRYEIVRAKVKINKDGELIERQMRCSALVPTLYVVRISVAVHVDNAMRRLTNSAPFLCLLSSAHLSFTCDN